MESLFNNIHKQEVEVKYLGNIMYQKYSRHESKENVQNIIASDSTTHTYVTIELVYGISAILQFTAQYFCIKCSSGKESCIASSLNLFRLDHPPGAHRGTSCQDL